MPNLDDCARFIRDQESTGRPVRDAAPCCHVCHARGELLTVLVNDRGTYGFCCAFLQDLQRSWRAPEDVLILVCRDDDAQ